MLNGGINVFETFTFVAPHEEHPDLNTMPLRCPHREEDLLDRDAPLHGVENALAPTLRADPHAKATSTFMRRRIIDIRER